MLPGYEPIPLSLMQTDELKFQAMRLNGLCSLYYFTKTILRKHRLNPRNLSDHFHIDLCDIFEKPNLKELIEIPRDHFKTTIGSEAFPMWRALRVSKQDEDVLTKLGYDASFIALLHKLHNPNIRILVVSEIERNAQKIGQRITIHYTSNDLFRSIYSDVLPGSDCIWNSGSMTHRRDPGIAHGEGTYNFLGTGSALQSNHFDIIIQDDLIGRDSEESQLNIEDGIRYHQLLVGAFDNADSNDPDALNDEVVIGNRWAEYDLNDWIREHEPYFNISSHSALGGCCSKHPAGVPIFPEEFSVKKLESYKARQGSYIFSCQFANSPINQATRIFKDEWLRYYSFTRKNGQIYISHELRSSDPIEAQIPDINVNNLNRYIVIDPKHSQEKTRCNHAITVTGLYTEEMLNSETGESYNRTTKYLLDSWSDGTNFEDFIEAIYRLADKWKVNQIWLETIGAQTYLKFHLEQENLRTGRFLDVKSLKTSTAANAKANRITALVPYFSNGEFFVRRDQAQFISEYETYPPRGGRKPIDVLDTLGYAPQVWELQAFNSDLDDLTDDQATKFEEAGIAGY